MWVKGLETGEMSFGRWHLGGGYSETRQGLHTDPGEECQDVQRRLDDGLKGEQKPHVAGAEDGVVESKATPGRVS